ncbi:MAG: hypothetical protein RML38_01995 [Bacteroidia bacterium]|nr:hypothetical protein [Bacteroidia bacterium]
MFCYFYVIRAIAQNIPSQPHLEYVKLLNPVWKKLPNLETDTIPIYTTSLERIVLFHAFTVDTIKPNLSLFFLGIVGECEIYFNKALLYKGKDRYGKILVNLPLSHLKKINVIQVVLCTTHQFPLAGLLQNVYLVKAFPERSTLTPPTYSSYQDTVALIYPYSYLYGFKGNKILLKRQLLELRQSGVKKVKFMFPPPEYAYTLCDLLDLFIVDNAESSLQRFYFNAAPFELKKDILVYPSWYNEAYIRTKHFKNTYTILSYLPSKIKYSAKVNLWLISCVLIGYLVLLKISFYDIITSSSDWFRRYRLIMETVKSKRFIPSTWVNLLTFLQWMIVAAVLCYIITDYAFEENPIMNSKLRILLQTNTNVIFVLWFALLVFVIFLHTAVSFFVSAISQIYQRGKILSRINEISIINHFPALYWIVGVLFLIPLSPSFLEQVFWLILYILIGFWLLTRLARMYRFGVKGLKLHSIVIILYLCGAEILPYFCLAFYIFNF